MDDVAIPPMAVQQLEKDLAAISLHELIAVLLTDGDVLLGGIFSHWKWDGRTLAIGFNSIAGKRFGESHSIEVPIELIADVTVIPLAESSIPRLPDDDPQFEFLRQVMGGEELIDTRMTPQEYPNPLASIICRHNTGVAASHGWDVGGLLLKAFSQDIIPPEGIQFEDDFLLYADWEFFNQQVSGALTLTGGIPGIVELSKEMTKSPQRRVLQRLREQAFTATVRRKLSPTTGEYSIRGRIQVEASPETTEIEGEQCHLWMVIGSGGDNCPALAKVRMLKYPLEFVGRVNSELTVYGELLPIPLEVSGTRHQKVLLARAVAYFQASSQEVSVEEEKPWYGRSANWLSQRMARIRSAIAVLLQSLLSRLGELIHRMR